MRRTVLTVGILLVIASLFVMQQGTQSLVPIAKTLGLASQTQVEQTLIAPTLLTIPASDHTFLSSDLQAGTEVRGSLEVVGDQEMAFYVMNEGNFTTWRSQQPAEVILARPVAIAYNFTFTAPSTGSYYFVFDNHDATRRTLIFGLTVVEHEIVLHPLLTFVDYELLFLGVAMALVGIRTGRRPAKEAKAEPVPIIEESMRCRFCGAELGSDKVFCSRCGRAQK